MDLKPVAEFVKDELFHAHRGVIHLRDADQEAARVKRPHITTPCTSRYSWAVRCYRVAE